MGTTLWFYRGSMWGPVTVSKEEHKQTGCTQLHLPTWHLLPLVSATCPQTSRWTGGQDGAGQGGLAPRSDCAREWEGVRVCVCTCVSRGPSLCELASLSYERACRLCLYALSVCVPSPAPHCPGDTPGLTWVFGVRLFHREQDGLSQPDRAPFPSEMQVLGERARLRLHGRHRRGFFLLPWSPPFPRRTRSRIPVDA